MTRVFFTDASVQTVGLTYMKTYDYTGTEAEEKEKAEKPQADIFIQEAVEKLKNLLGTQVQIKTGRKKSKVEIEFYSEEDLERILGLIGQQREASNQERIEKLRQFSQMGKFTV